MQFSDMYDSITPPEWYRNVIFGVLAHGLYVIIIIQAVFTLGARALVPGNRHKIDNVSFRHYVVARCHYLPEYKIETLHPNSGVNTWKKVSTH